MKLLITGACGFIGTNFINSLLAKKSDIQIIGLDNLSTGTYIHHIHDNIEEMYEVDIRNREHVFNVFKIERPDMVLHLGGLVSIYDCHNNPSLAFENNVSGSINVLDAAVKYDVKKVICAETSAVYENSPLNESGYTENQSDPTTIYAVTKATLALLLKSYHRLHGLDYTALRFFNVAGVLQDYKRTIPAFHCGVTIRCLNDKSPIIFGDETRRRDFIHVDDVCSFLELTLTDPRTANETYNLGCGKSYSLSELVSLIKSTLGKEHLDTLYMDQINGEAHTIFANIEKAKSLGWKPIHSMNAIVLDTIAYIKEEISKGNISSDYMDNLDLSKVKIGK